MKVVKSPEAIEYLSIEHRMMLLAYARMNPAGHATFEAPRGKPDQSELRELVGHVDKKTGERVLCSARVIYKAKRRLADAGLLVESSGGLVCIWVSVEHAERGVGGTAICPFHRWRKSGTA